MTTQNNYETAPEYDADAYVVDGWGKGIAFYVLGWETEPTEDTKWSGYEERTGKLVVRMVGDDRNFAEEPESITALKPKDFCRSCGQVGCGCNVYE